MDNTQPEEKTPEQKKKDLEEAREKYRQEQLKKIQAYHDEYNKLWLSHLKNRHIGR